MKIIFHPCFIFVIPAIHPVKHLNEGRKTGMEFLMLKSGLKKRCCLDFTKMLLGSFTDICSYDFIKCMC